MSINAVKGIEIGDGFGVVTLKGTENRDELTKNGFTSNHAGGILGGISSGQPIVAHIALKPTSALLLQAKRLIVMVDMITKGRHDPCVGIRYPYCRSNDGNCITRSCIAPTWSMW